MVKPLLFNFLSETLTIYFVFDREWHWIFHRPDGYQKALTEQEVKEFLGISRRTAIYWRTGQRQPNKAALYLLYIHTTGRVLTVPMMRSQIIVEGETLKYKGRKMQPQDLPEWEYMRWMLRQANNALEGKPTPFRFFVLPDTKKPAEAGSSGTG